MSRWYPRPVGEGDPEIEFTQRNDFRLDEHELLEIVAREFIQNALDAAADADDPVRVNIRSVSRPLSPGCLQPFLEGLIPHAEASDLSWDRRARPFALVLEDRGTTGLTGRTDVKEEREDGKETPWTDFWWRFGRSGKTGAKQGRNGLGRISYAIASGLGAFWVLTRRGGERENLLMGMALLNLRKVNGQQYHPLMHWGERASETALVTPVRDPGTIGRFCDCLGIERHEAGVTVVIPYPLRDDGDGPVRIPGLVPSIIRNQFFALLRGRLRVTIGSTVLDRNTILEEADPADRDFLQFVSEAVTILEQDEGTTADIDLPPDWHSIPPDQHLGLDEETVTRLREKLDAKNPLVVRAPLEVRRWTEQGRKRRRGKPRPGDVTRHEGSVTAVLRKVDQGGRDLYVRDNLAILGEKHIRGRNLHAVVVAEGDVVAELLGDAENAAHTKWVLKNDRLGKKYSNARDVIRAVRQLLPSLHDLLVGTDDERDEEALARFFAGVSRSSNEPGKDDGDPPPPPPGKPRVVTVRPLPPGDGHRHVAGFRVRYRPPAPIPDVVGLLIDVSYLTVTGSAARDQRATDFQGRYQLRVTGRDPEELHVVPLGPGRLKVEFPGSVTGNADPLEKATVEVRGLDPHREPRVSVKVLKRGEEPEITA